MTVRLSICKEMYIWLSVCQSVQTCNDMYLWLSVCQILQMFACHSVQNMVFLKLFSILLSVLLMTLYMDCPFVMSWFSGVTYCGASLPSLMLVPLCFQNFSGSSGSCILAVLTRGYKGATGLSRI